MKAKSGFTLGGLVAAAAMLLGFVQTAQAVPSFARQTGLACQACHTVVPELTQFGRTFKMNGYVLTGLQQIQSEGGHGIPKLKINEIPPLSAMFLTSVTSMKKALPDSANPPNGQPRTQNGNMEFPQQLSFFFAGEIAPHIGTFMQLTYDHQQDHFGIDNTDIRFTNHATVGGQDAIYGLTLNNNPTVEDPWQGTPAWGFPFVSSGVMLSPPATLIDGTLAQDVAGIGGYTLWGNHLYGNLSFYRSEHTALAQPYGTSATNTIKGVAPYWRLAYQTNLGENYLEVGSYGISADMNPNGVSGDTDKYVDTAVDAQWERSFGENSMVVRGTYIHEKTNWDASYLAGSVSNPSDTLKTFKLNGTYHFGSSKALSLGFFDTKGSSDALRYAPALATGSANGSPDSTGWILQGTYLPYQNVQIGLQYTAFTKFMGSGTNYDGSGRNASDNNTLYLYSWMVF